MDIVLVVIAIVAAALAGALGFVLGRQRGQASGTAEQAELVAARLQIDGLRRDVEAARAETSGRVEEERRLGAQRVAEARELAEAALAEVRRDAAQRMQDERAAHERRLAEVRAEAEKDVLEERRRAEQRIEELRADTKRLADEFEALSKRALDANAKTFLAQAEERLKRSQSEGAAELRRRQEAVEKLIEPIQKTLDTVKSEMTSAEKARAEANAALTEQLQFMRQSSEALGSETRNLVNALRAPQVRGRWGELQLRRVVEAAGMLNHVDFAEQEHHRTDEGALRPDLVIHLAGDKRVVVDSKVAFNGYLEAMEATDETVRMQRLQAHARHLKKHIDDLGTKEYWDAVAGSPEFVVMFVPAEPFLTAALDQDATLYEYAFERNVVIATPSTLVALLRTVGHAWRQEQLAQEAHQIFTVGKELHKRLGTLGQHLATLGKRLNSTVEAYNRFAGSLDRNVVTQARRFSALQGLEDVLTETDPIETLAIAPQKADLYLTEGREKLTAETEGLATETESLEAPVRYASADIKEITERLR
ncbi:MULTISPECIES: DNA recombination protein RmuC [Microbacterium]|uniref:DNA recombination protein RmuC n=1 Tax=Microbacterium TaxID=33882 RepID=UPI00217CF480|nr:MULTISPECIES: DNA recombination protein RmuC [Microbacterium]UWF77220.1 DNA recombination protein RmuC [Microbacterium neungamense]WCM55376.1 DNA recombination protein RmuC [Microbacterium sp. EF45047]